MYFQLPTSEFLARSLHGALVWYDGWNAAPRSTIIANVAPHVPQGTAPAIRDGIDQPQRTCDGFTLYACAGAGAEKPFTQAFLINMQREIVHRWSIPFSRIWVVPKHLPNRPPDSDVSFFACHLYSNGDLLAVIHHNVSPPMGCGLVKLDKDSEILWAYPAAMHHDVDVDEDGSIYAIQHQVVNSMPKGLEAIATPCKIDYLHVLSPEGKLLGEPISILEAFLDSPYASLLDSLKWPIKRSDPAPWSTVPSDDEYLSDDPLHTNSVKVLSRSLAAHFPFLRAGQALVSIRDMNVLAVIDPKSGKVVWAARGPWCAQHDAQFLDNGNFLLYDNLGVAMGSRVLEYDPQTQAIPWFYSGAPNALFYSGSSGACQRLPNGNTLIVNSEGGEILEVTAAKDIVWSASTGSFINAARRYSPDELRFLRDGPRARP